MVKPESSPETKNRMNSLTVAPFSVMRRAMRAKIGVMIKNIYKKYINVIIS